MTAAPISRERALLRRALERSEQARAACIADTEARAAALGMSREGYLEHLEELARQERRSRRLVTVFRGNE